jgi:hypothetical protein
MSMLTAVEIQILADARARLAAGGYRSADDYHQDRDTIRQLVAKSLNKTQTSLDPMGFWHGSQSN